MTVRHRISIYCPPQEEAVKREEELEGTISALEDVAGSLRQDLEVRFERAVVLFFRVLVW